MRHPGFITALVCLACLGMLADASASVPYRPEGVLEEMIERPDDPPGVPAQVAPDAPQAQPVLFGDNASVQVNVSPSNQNIPGDAANEPSIAFDPNDPLKLAIGWRQFDTISSNFRQAGHAFSTDGGRTWINTGVPLDAGVFRSDPVLRWDSTGKFYYSSLRGTFDTDIYRSTDQGVDWGLPIYAFGGDKQWLAIDRTGGPGEGNIYQAWSEFATCGGCGPNIFTRSTDGGASYESPLNFPNNPIFGTMDVAPDGTLYIAGTDPSNFGNFLVARSTNAQNDEEIPSFTSVAVDLGGSIGLQDDPNPSGLLGQVNIGADPTIPGNIYVACTVDPPGTDPMDVHFVRSTDGGQTWSAPIRVNDDSGNNWQWFGTMSVAPNGRIDLIWNDSRNTGVANFSELFYAYSTDQGTTWSTNEQLSPFWNSHVGWPNQNKIGDYYDMISDKVGAHLAWAATFNNEQDVYYLRINDYDCNDNGVGDAIDIQFGPSNDSNENGIPDECEGITAVAAQEAAPAAGGLAQNAPNPFNPRTTITYEIERAAHISIAIVDPAGRLIRTLLDQTVDAGKGSVEWDGRDAAGTEVASGLYMYQLDVDGKRETRKMVLIR